MRILVVLAVTTALLAGGTPASAKPPKAPKPPNPCKVLLPDDLETIFSQPWRKGISQVGGACNFRRPDGVKVPDISVSLIVEQKKTPKKARKVFARERSASRDIVDQMETVKGLGQESYLTTILGADALIFRVGRDLVDLRVDRVDQPETTYHDEILAIGDVVEARLLPPPPKRTRSHTGSGGG